MKRRWWLVGLACLVAVLGTAPPVLAGQAGSSVTDADPVVLTLTGANGAMRSYTMPQLKAGLPVYVGYAGSVKSGFIAMEAPHPVKGVLLVDLLKKVGYDSTNIVTITASDGYAQELTIPAVQGRDVPVYQALPPTYPQVEMPSDNPLAAVVSYQQKSAGASIDDASPWENYSTPETTPKAEGPLRLWYAYRTWADPGFLTPSSKSVRMVSGITVTGLTPNQWSVPVRGPRATFKLSRTQFKDWTAGASYGQTTVRVGGHKYSGLPLYVVVGMVDGGTATAFDTRLARKGYGIRFVSASRTVTLSSKRIAERSRQIILAWKRDGVELTGKAAPLWLVGRPLGEAQRISGIKSITLRGVPK